MGQILLNGIVKSYGKEVVVKNLDLKVETGEFLTILGPSGCGKTTTLRMVAGLEEPDQGMIKLDDKVVFSRNDGVVVPPEARHLGLIFQSYALWPHMTVAKNITLALKEQKISKSEIADRLKNAAATKKLAIFDAFEILNRIEAEKEAIESLEKGTNKTNTKQLLSGRYNLLDFF